MALALHSSTRKYVHLGNLATISSRDWETLQVTTTKPLEAASEPLNGKYLGCVLPTANVDEAVADAGARSAAVIQHGSKPLALVRTIWNVCGTSVASHRMRWSAPWLGANGRVSKQVRTQERKALVRFASVCRTAPSAALLARVAKGGLGLLAPSVVAVADALGDAMSADDPVIAD